MNDENKVAGQARNETQNLCGDCEGFNLATCKKPKSDRFKGRVDKKSAACKLFKHV